MDRDDARPAPELPSARKPYTRPILRPYGTVEEITGKLVGSVTDGLTGSSVA